MKKGFIFMIDVGFAIMILVAGYFMITHLHSIEENEPPLFFVANNIMDILSSVSIKDLCPSDTVCDCSTIALQDLCTEGLIYNKEQKIISYVAELYETGDTERARTFLSNMIDDQQLNKNNLISIEIVVDGVRIYPSNDISEEKTNANELITLKKVLFGSFEQPRSGDVFYYGPYLAELSVWVS